MFLGCELLAGGLWKGDILIADLEELRKLDESDLYPRRINATEILISQKDDEFIFPFADGTAIWSVRDSEFQKHHSKAGANRKERRFQQRTSR